MPLLCVRAEATGRLPRALPPRRLPRQPLSHQQPTRVALVGHLILLPPHQPPHHQCRRSSYNAADAAPRSAQSHRAVGTEHAPLEGSASTGRPCQCGPFCRWPASLAAVWPSPRGIRPMASKSFFQKSSESIQLLQQPLNICRNLYKTRKMQTKFLLNPFRDIYTMVRSRMYLSG
jgi:hypothetical protein